MKLNRIATSVSAALVIGLVASDLRAGVTCYDMSSYAPNFISAVQDVLIKARFNPGPADGRWGPKTRSALEAYQRARHLPSTGDIDASTLRALFGPEASAEKYGLSRNDMLPAELYSKHCQ